MFTDIRICCRYVVIALVAWTVVLLGEPVHGQVVEIRVDAQSGSANPSGQGNGWNGNAFKYLWDAIARANFLLNNQQATSVQIWVRGFTSGTPIYLPDEDRFNPGPNGNNDRARTFSLGNNIAILGGFNTGMTNVNQRNPFLYITVLSGDIDRDGLLDSQNSQHVVTAEFVGPTARIDGFTIKHGYSDGNGAGITMTCGMPVIRGCTITANYASVDGGGIGVSDVAPRCSYPEIRNCRILNNEAEGQGGGIWFWDGGKVFNTVIDGNVAAEGGGITVRPDSGGNASLDTLLICCNITNNSAVRRVPLTQQGAPVDGNGGGIFAQGASFSGLLK